MFYPKISQMSEVRPNTFEWVYDKILFLKQKIRDSIQYEFSPPKSSILEGTILGDNGAMSQDLKDKLSITGLRHIIAVSGTHVIILSSIVMSLLLALGLKRTDAFYFAIAFICFYIILTGLPASGIRAGVMGGLYLLAQKLGRQSLGVRVVVMACAVMLIFNPLLLFFDVGFQLSFLAVIGLIYLEPIFTKIMKVFAKGLPAEADKAENFIKIVSATFAAQVFTIPIILYSFGNISFISPITNLLVLPIVYWLMIFGFLSAFAGIFLPIAGWILSVPCYFLLKYFLWVIDFFSQPWAIKTFENVHWTWLVFLYLIIIFATRYLNKKFVEKF
jgi:competence protein ComEC